MALCMKELVAECRAQVQAVTPQQAHDSGELILDVCEPSELEASRRVAWDINQLATGSTPATAALTASVLD